ncbi:hypothetical protein EJ110_NYTH39439 [Nymphaea thermarum]|nr:hypothetical protein EJ110_NYTH39439 [Nymphaea thermarum]
MASYVTCLKTASTPMSLSVWLCALIWILHGNGAKGVKENNRLKLKCSICGNTFSGGISRMKHHLAGTSKDVSPCVGGPNKPLPPFVRQQCLDMLHALRQKKIQKEIEEADVGYNEPFEDEEEEEEAYECDDEDDSNRRGKGIIDEGAKSKCSQDQ